MPSEVYLTNYPWVLMSTNQTNKIKQHLYTVFIYKINYNITSLTRKWITHNSSLIQTTQYILMVNVKYVR